MNNSIKVKCVVDHIDGITSGESYELLSIEECAGKLYRIIDDNNKSKRYNIDFFDDINYQLMAGIGKIDIIDLSDMTDDEKKELSRYYGGGR